MSEKRRILMLENDKVFTNKIAIQLRRKKVEVVQVATEKEAIKLLKDVNQHFDLLTIDFILESSDHNNEENIEKEKEQRRNFIQKLRKEEVTISITVISSYNTPIIELQDIGVNSYINKKETAAIATAIQKQIESSISYLLDEHSFLSEEEKDEETSLDQIQYKIDTLTKIITTLERSRLSRYAVRYRERRRKLQFKQRLRKKLRINEVYFTNLVSFKNVYLKPQPNINILLGNNGYGKTFLSRILLALMSDNQYALQFFNIPTKVTEDLNPREIKARIHIKVEGEEDDIVIDQNKAFFNSATPKIPILAIPDVRTFDRSRRQLPTDIQEDIVGNSAKAFIEKRPFNNTILHLLNLLCGYYREEDIYKKKVVKQDKEKNEEQKKTEEEESRKQTETAAEGENKEKKKSIFTMLQKVFTELTDGTFEFVKVGLATEDDNNIYVKSSFTNGEIIKLQDASQGTLSVFVIFGLIYHYLKLKNEVKEGDASLTDGIVFIDEIDSHLHPSWQQKIVPLLREHFPNVQFFLNSHSSAIVQGALLREVSVLHKNEYGVYLHQHKKNSFIGVPISDLLESKNVFDTEDKDAKYEEYASRWLYEDSKVLEDRYEQAINENKSQDKIEALKNDWIHMKNFEEQFQNREARLITKQLVAENRRLRKKVKESQNNK